MTLIANKNVGKYKYGDSMEFDRKDENYVYSFIGKNIKKYRKKAGLTQEQLAIKANYSKQFISNIENNVHQTFSLGTLWRLSIILNVEMYKLCMEEKDKLPKKTKGNLTK